MAIQGESSRTKENLQSLLQLKKPPALLITNGFFIFYLLTPATVAGHKTLQRHTHRNTNKLQKPLTPLNKKNTGSFTNQWLLYILSFYTCYR
jgi:hypothetical protein